MFEVLAETSKFVSSARKLQRGYCNFERRLDGVYKNSQIYIIVKKNWKTIKIYGGYSFLGRITEPKEEKGDIAIVNNSAVVKRLKNLSKKWLYNLVFYFKISKSGNLLEQFKKDFYTLPIKTLTTIIIIVITTNIIFSILLKDEINFLGWILRVSLLFIAYGGLSSYLAWENIKKTSYFIRYMNNSFKS